MFARKIHISIFTILSDCDIYLYPLPCDNNYLAHQVFYLTPDISLLLSLVIGSVYEVISMYYFCQLCAGWKIFCLILKLLSITFPKDN